uniref:pirin family protein n=1 Tax=Hymenobacter sp. AT01-02 TaxID=1571877 RepID=UPI0006E3DE5F
ATLTYLLSGEGLHRDSRGNTALVRSGGAQWMSAGNGILHDESINPDAATRSSVTHGLQFWINLPAQQKAQLPEYRSLPARALPTVALPHSAGWLKVIVGEWAGQTSPVPTYSPQFLYTCSWQRVSSWCSLPRPDTSTPPLCCTSRPWWGASATRPASFCYWTPPSDAPLVLSAAPGSAADFIVFGGAPYTEPIVAQGPFVMNTRQEIIQPTTTSTRASTAPSTTDQVPALA